MLREIAIVIAVLVAGALVGITAATANDPHGEGCIQVVASRKLVIFANTCAPEYSFSLVAKELPAYATE